MAITGALAAAARVFDPYPEFATALVFKGLPETGGRQFYKSSGLIVPRFEMVSGVQIIGGAGFGQREINTAWRGARADEPLIGDGGLRNAEARTEVATWSNDLTNAAWVTANLSRTLVPGPGGEGQATRLQVLSIGVATIAVRGFSSWAATQACTHLIVKLGTASSAIFYLRNSSTSTVLCQAVLNSGGVTFSGTYAAKCKATALPDGWWLIELYADGGITIGDTLQTYQGWGGGVVSTGGNIDIYTSGIRAAPPISDPPIITQGLPATRTGYSYQQTGLSIAPVHYGVVRARLVAAAANHAASLPTLLNARPTTGSAQVLWYVLKSDGSQRFAITGDDGVDTAIDPGVSPVVGDYEVIAWASRSGSLAISRAGGAVQTAAVSSIANPFTRVGYMGDAATPAANTSNAEMDIFATWNGEISNDALQALSARFAA